MDIYIYNIEIHIFALLYGIHDTFSFRDNRISGGTETPTLKHTVFLTLRKVSCSH